MLRTGYTALTNIVFGSASSPCTRGKPCSIRVQEPGGGGDDDDDDDDGDRDSAGNELGGGIGAAIARKGRSKSATSLALPVRWYVCHAHRKNVRPPEEPIAVVATLTQDTSWGNYLFSMLQPSGHANEHATAEITVDAIKNHKDDDALVVDLTDLYRLARNSERNAVFYAAQRDERLLSARLDLVVNGTRRASTTRKPNDSKLVTTRRKQPGDSSHAVNMEIALLRQGATVDGLLQGDAAGRMPAGQFPPGSGSMGASGELSAVSRSASMASLTGGAGVLPVFGSPLPTPPGTAAAAADAAATSRATTPSSFASRGRRTPTAGNEECKDDGAAEVTFRDFVNELMPLMRDVEVGATAEPVERLCDALREDAGLCGYFATMHPATLAALNLARFLCLTDALSADTRRTVGFIMFLVGIDPKFGNIEEYVVGRTTLHTLHALLRTDLLLREAVGETASHNDSKDSGDGANSQCGDDADGGDESSRCAAKTDPTDWLASYVAASDGKADHWRKIYTTIVDAITNLTVPSIEGGMMELRGRHFSSMQRVLDVVRGVLDRHLHLGECKPVDASLLDALVRQELTDDGFLAVFNKYVHADVPMADVLTAYKFTVVMVEHASDELGRFSDGAAEPSLIYNRRVRDEGVFLLLCTLEARIVALDYMERVVTSRRTREVSDLLGDVHEQLAQHGAAEAEQIQSIFRIRKKDMPAPPALNTGSLDRLITAESRAAGEWDGDGLADADDSKLRNSDLNKVNKARAEVARLRVKQRELLSREVLLKLQLFALGSFQRFVACLRLAYGLSLMQMDALRFILQSSKRLVPLIELQLRVGVFGVMRAGKTSLVCALVGSVFSTIRERATTALPLVVVHDPDRVEPQMRLPCFRAFNSVMTDLRMKVTDRHVRDATDGDAILLDFWRRVVAGDVSFNEECEGVPGCRTVNADCNDLVRLFARLRVKYADELRTVADLSGLVSDPDLCPTVRVAFSGLRDYRPIGELALVDTPGIGESFVAFEDMLRGVVKACSKHVLVLHCKHLGLDSEKSLMGILHDKASYPPDLVLNQKDLNRASRANRPRDNARRVQAAAAAAGGGGGGGGGGGVKDADSIESLVQITRKRYAAFSDEEESRHRRRGKWNGLSVSACSAYYALNAIAARKYVQDHDEVPEPCRDCEDGAEHECEVPWLPDFAEVAFGMDWCDLMLDDNSMIDVERFSRSAEKQYERSGIGATTRKFVTDAARSTCLNIVGSALMGDDTACKKFTVSLQRVRESVRLSKDELGDRLQDLAALNERIARSCDAMERSRPAYEREVADLASQAFLALKQGEDTRALVESAMPDVLDFHSREAMRDAMQKMARGLYMVMREYIGRERQAVYNTSVRGVVDKFRGNVGRNVVEAVEAWNDARQRSRGMLSQVADNELLKGLVDVLKNLDKQSREILFEDRSFEAEAEGIAAESEEAKVANTKRWYEVFFFWRPNWRDWPWKKLVKQISVKKEEVLQLLDDIVDNVHAAEERAVTERASTALREMASRVRAELDAYMRAAREAAAKAEQDMNLHVTSDEVLSTTIQKIYFHRSELDRALACIEQCTGRTVPVPTTRDV